MPPFTRTVMVEKFIEIFDGLKRSHGVSRDTGVVRDDGKNEFDSKILHVQVTTELYQKHLEVKNLL